MKLLRRTMMSVIVAVCLAPSSLPADEPPLRLGLLVGVQTYEKLGAAEQLEGCRNDVQAMKDVLVERLGFSPENIVTLVDEEATASAIRVQFRRLIQRIRELPDERPPAQVVFHFSGHGSQIPDQLDAGADEPTDGLDETLVLFDATEQGGPEDIRDDELFDLAEHLCGAGRARLWIILDCCHSGSGARGVTRIRQLNRSHLTRTREVARPGSSPPARQLPHGAVALYACRAIEVEPEYRDQGSSYGLLTRFLVQVLHEVPTLSRLSYGQLRDAIVTRYRQDRSVVQPPTPLVEGDKRAVVCGATSDADRPNYWPVVAANRRGDQLALLAGALHGVTAGSLYEIYERPEETSQQNADSLAWLRVTSVDGTTAKAQVFVWEGDERLDERLPRNFQRGYAVERHHDYGDFAMRVRVERVVDGRLEATPLTQDDGDVPPALQQAFARAAQASPTSHESRWLQWTTANEPCDFVLRLDGPWAALFPATGMAEIFESDVTTRGSTIPASLVGGWGDERGPVDLRLEEQAASRLLESFRKIVRARNLIRIASQQRPSFSTSRDSPQVKLELMRVTDPDDPSQWQRWPTAQEAAIRGASVMRRDDLYALRITNLESSGPPIFVTVLQVDGNMGIDVIHPDSSGSLSSDDLADASRLDANQSLDTPIWICNASGQAAQPSDDVAPPIYGPRFAIALATRQPNEFYRLGQSSLHAVRSRPQLLAQPSMLSALLQEGVHLKTRGVPKRYRPGIKYEDSWAAELIQWVAIP